MAEPRLAHAAESALEREGGEHAGRKSGNAPLATHLRPPRFDCITEHPSCQRPARRHQGLAGGRIVPGTPHVVPLHAAPHHAWDRGIPLEAPCLTPIPVPSPGAVQVDDGERPRLPPAHGPRLLVPRHLGPRGRKARAQVTSIQYLSFVMPLLSRTRKAALRSFGGLCLDWRLSYG